MNISEVVWQKKIQVRQPGCDFVLYRAKDLPLQKEEYHFRSGLVGQPATTETYYYRDGDTREYESADDLLQGICNG